MRFPLYRVSYEYNDGEFARLIRPWIYKEDPGLAEVERQAYEAWPTIHWGDDRSQVLRAVWVTRGLDTDWALAWFSHQTFRAGRTDEELLESFEQYVRRYEDMQDYDGPEPPPGYRCLMGAEDRRRWKPFCRCAACVRDDIALVAH